MSYSKEHLEGRIVELTRERDEYDRRRRAAMRTTEEFRKIKNQLKEENARLKEENARLKEENVRLKDAEHYIETNEALKELRTEREECSPFRVQRHKFEIVKEQISDHFQDKQVELDWWEAPNPRMGGLSPLEVERSGDLEHLYEAVDTMFFEKKCEAARKERPLIPSWYTV